MLNRIKSFFISFYKAGIYTFIDHDGTEHAGYLAFLGLLSLFPFLLFFVVIAGLVGEAQLGSELAREVQAMLPDHVITALKPRMDEIAAGPPKGLVWVMFIGIIWTASATVEGARTALNRAYRVSTPPAYIWRRLRSLVEFMVLTAFLMIAMAIFILTPVIIEQVFSWFEPETGMIIEDFLDGKSIYLRYGIAGGIIFLTIASSYHILPNIKQRLRNVVLGALVATILWLLAAELFTLYLQNFELVNLVYGSLGGIIATLIFFYILAFIYIFGAEFNYLYDKYSSDEIREKERQLRGERRKLSYREKKYLRQGREKKYPPRWRKR